MRPRKLTGSSAREVALTRGRRVVLNIISNKLKIMSKPRYTTRVGCRTTADVFFARGARISAEFFEYFTQRA